MRRKALSVGAREELTAYLESRPPPPMLQQRRDRFEDRLETPSAIHDLHALQAAQRKADIDAIESRFELEREKRIGAELSLKAISDRFWVVLTGVVIILIAAAFLYPFKVPHP